MKYEHGNVEWQGDLSVSYGRVGQVLFDLDRAGEALSNFNAAIQISKPPDNSDLYWRRALAKLYTNDAAGAADDAAMALKLKPADPYYAIWLHVARARTGLIDADELASNSKKIERSKWPWPIVALFLGSMVPDEAKSAALSADDESTRVGQSCEADFYIGAYQIEKGAQADARTLFQSAVDHCLHDSVEYPAAKLELKRLNEPAGARAK